MAKPKRYLLITEKFPPRKGGSNLWFHEVYRRIGDKDTHIVTCDQPRARAFDASHPNTVHRLTLDRHWWLRPESLAIYAKLVATSLVLAARYEFDEVHAGRVLSEGLVGLLVARLKGLPLVIYAHGEEITTWRQPGKFQAMVFTYRQANCLIANSDFTRNELLKLGVKPNRIALILPGVDLNRFRPGLKASDLRTSLGLTEGQKLILSVGRLSRWTDASSLPSRPIPAKEIELAANEEVEEFAKTFGCRPRVAVPPTFVWNPSVERAWAVAGIEVIVTPGQCSERRALDGAPQSVGSAIHNGQRSSSGPTYVVRDHYFEPAFGHTAERALNAIAKNTRMGRPTLLETHRFNFTDDPAVAENSFTQLKVLLTEALTRYADLVFISTEELAHGLRKAESNLLETRLMCRFHVWLQRLYEVPPLRKLACLCGLIVPAFLMFLATSQHRKPDPKTSAPPLVKSP